MSTDPEVAAMGRISAKLRTFDVATRRRMLWWLMERDGELSRELGEAILHALNAAPVRSTVKDTP